jgi:FixJ family two-component response regulator
MLHTNQKPHDSTLGTVFIVDDDEAVRDSLQWLIETEGYTVRCYDNAISFMDDLQWPQVCVVLLDIRMPRVSGLEVQKTLNQKNIPVPIVFITGHGDVSMAVDTMKKGAVDFIEKPFDEFKIKSAIHQHMNTARQLVATHQEESQLATLFGRLTSREIQVLNLIVQGRLNKQIADDLNISIKTVEAHRANLMDKLQADNVADLLKLTLKHAALQKSTHDGIL